TLAVGERYLGDDLNTHPDEQKNPGRDLHEPGDNYEGHDGQHAGMRMMQQIRAEHPAYGTAGAHQRNLRVHIAHRVAELGDDIAKHIENEVAKGAAVVLNVVPKDPENPHIGDEVHPAAMHEHGRENEPPGARRTTYEFAGHVARNVHRLIH